MKTTHPFHIASQDEFEQFALALFREQAFSCAVYRQYLHHLGIAPASIRTSHEIPFMPISFFKNYPVISENHKPDIVFTSSGTTGNVSRHPVSDIRIYEKSFTTAFRHFYGNPQGKAILALLPNYLEREGSSLIYMVEHLIRLSGRPESGFFLYDHQLLHETLLQLCAAAVPTILFGVSFALLDFIETYRIDFPELIVIETGGMKGKRKELIREELHNFLSTGFGTTETHSEYGMTELLSQAYAGADNRFRCPPWMRILIRDVNDPLSLVPSPKTGGINVIDLANIHSCAFIATQDLGRLYEDGSFDVLGRFDYSDIRGCNLLVQ